MQVLHHRGYIEAATSWTKKRFACRRPLKRSNWFCSVCTFFESQIPFVVSRAVHVVWAFASCTSASMNFILQTTLSVTICGHTLIKRLPEFLPYFFNILQTNCVESGNGSIYQAYIFEVGSHGIYRGNIWSNNSQSSSCVIGICHVHVKSRVMEEAD